MLAVQHQANGTVSYCAGCGPLLVIVIHFHIREIRLHLASARASIHFEPNFLRHSHRDIPMPVVDLHVAWRLELDFHGAILILDSQIA